jgi:cold shock protein
MLEGSIKFFNDVKGFGFIIPDGSNEKEVFFHFSAMKNKKQQINKTDKDKRVSYELKDGKNGPEAENVVFI